MKTQIVRTNNGWYIPDLPGFDDIRDNTIAVSVELDIEELMQRDYKELRGIAILERYQEMVAYEDTMPAVIDDKEKLRCQFGLERVNSLTDLLTRLQ